MAVITVMVDTNAYTAFKLGQAEALEIIQRAPALTLSSIVIGELLAGFAMGSREAQNRAELQQFLASPRVSMRPIDDHTAQYYARVYRILKQKGKPIPTNDMWIAASALQTGSVLFSFDGHFQHIDGLVVGTSAIDLLLA
ncbi:type II toxin-antitoxin system VapC family toxin [Candidatus Viridilinea mediisalina]|uniref:Ribonuclease VapC n=1 Tax=Candidatus Viridilinea mediisalina TaxID=2024553 RepID=A0A2A6RQ97_9CHLR|nr:type II toxin-antitoxin system VapC family toxin [Candidatus Viridilinea mediisalina]PDW05088.1 VapC toxin family PIN domain ribonuclease [Candidatus Viridilinea mediisalina]